MRLKLTALADSDPAIRERAADVLLFDEPVAAEAALLEAALDPDTRVAVMAIDTAKYYYSAATARRLGELLAHPNAQVREAAAEGLRDLQGVCHGYLNRADERGRARIRRWMEPVRHLLERQPEDLKRDLSTHPYVRQTRVGESVEQLLVRLADADAPLGELRAALQAEDWGGYSLLNRSLLRAAFLSHPDPVVRECAPRILAAWGDTAGLRLVLDDPIFRVRQQATYYLGTLPRDPSIAAPAWSRFEHPRARGFHRTEALTTYIAHADPSEAIPRLAAIAADRSRAERVRHAAVCDLSELRAADAIRSLDPILAEPPLTWALHISLLDAFADLGLAPPDPSHLQDVDNLDLQVALALFDRS